MVGCFHVVHNITGHPYERGAAVRKAGHDVYGQKIDNHDANGELVTCSICKKAVSAARFAPHLEKCMGMGRQARAKRSAAAGAGARSTPVKSSAAVLIDHEDVIDCASQTSHTESDAKSKHPHS